MGGDLAKAPAGKAPTFLVAAMKDPLFGNLDRIQIVKGWLGKDGKAQERVYDVAWVTPTDASPAGRQAAARRQHSGRRERDVDQHHRRSGTRRGVAGPGLRPGAACVLLRPRDRDPDAALDGLRPGALRHQDVAEVPMVQQERAWTSPIWYTPGK